MDALAQLSAAAAELLKASGETVAVAESSAGGLISAALLAQPGASAYFRGGGVIYTAQARAALLPDPGDATEWERASTEAYALWLARTIAAHLGADWGVAETGAAGPTGNRYGDAPGHCCIAVAGPVDHAATIETGHGRREDNMRAFAAAALDLLAEAIRQSQ